QVSGSACTEHANGVLIFGMHAEHENREARGFGVDLFKNVEAVPVRHRDIEKHDITRIGFDHSHAFITIAGFAAHRHAGVFRDNSLQAFTHDGLIINYNHIDHILNPQNNFDAGS